MSGSALSSHKRRKRAMLYYRVPYFSVAVLLAIAFVSALYLIRPPQQEFLDLAGRYYPELSQEERNRHSFYNWLTTRYVDLKLQSKEGGMVVLRAANREILYQSFLEKNIVEDLHLSLPEDLNQIMIEYGERIEYLDLEKSAETAGLREQERTPFIQLIKVN